MNAPRVDVFGSSNRYGVSPLGSVSPTLGLMQVQSPSNMYTPLQSSSDVQRNFKLPDVASWAGSFSKMANASNYGEMIDSFLPVVTDIVKSIASIFI